jgi:cell division protein FtsQ
VTEPTGTPSGAADGRIDDRIAERRREVRRDRQRGRRRRTVTILAVVLAVAALVGVERSPLVGLESVEVVGTDRLTEEEVLDAADLELGTSTLRLRLGRVEDRVEELPLTLAADARRLDPLRVRIDVTERVPVLVAHAGQDRALVDRSGQVIATGDVEGLPTITVTGDLPAPGERGPVGGPVDVAVSAWRGLSGPLRAEVVRYDTGPDEDLDLQLRSGVTVRFGRPERIDEKVRALGAVLEDVGDTRVTAIDVRAPARPVVVP